MSQEKDHKQNSHRHGHHNADHSTASKKKMIHHDWRFWTAITLMILAMVAYVLSLDEAMAPTDVDQAEVPMVAE
ncbi:hypothetical protein FF011L_02800 [Roseimaritima multifibrata]|uniref:Uncharacterized protein n=1 Tax=Roseimaritima multifibrata TaxID=1930274 RepID=A0A517M9I5_9BACT|nr:hypothetical protein [Roseimaritima multifibrata]QDS91550.1 hypothetical protein FF011L_02800 [Roseimaritima multifibrata]